MKCDITKHLPSAEILERLKSGAIALNKNDIIEVIQPPKYGEVRLTYQNGKCTLIKHTEVMK